MNACSVAHSCPSLCDTMDCNPPGSSIYGTLQAKEYWIGLLFAPPGDLPDPGIKHWHGDPLPLSPTWEAQMDSSNVYNLVIFPRFTV